VQVVLGGGRQKIGHPRDAFIDGHAQGPPIRPARCLNVR
jgi:hypothetical protein